MKVLSVLLFLSLTLSVAFAALGVDISSGSTIPDLQCFKNKGYTRAIFRCYQSIGRPDPNCPHNIYNARDAGFSIIDGYIFPCFSCGNPAGQIQSMVKYYKSFNANIHTIWIDVEGPGVYWSESQTANRNFFNGLIDGCKSQGLKIGIYTSASQWGPIMGNWDGGKAYPLWYAHYDNNPSFSDFSPFGGWSTPYMKQFSGNDNECGLGVDKNYFK
ncbi:hypothetical protein CYY_001021 [Polysphondylium violaceum]|uniref:lysozyme n=1 Tax=Polysphondylium violaceum TaxID=133409 RepID=A0A8J4Q2L7_9MYCE|nr:hypothetical protein CYY_001021 [Polysphondylium violaceum]